MAGNVEQMTAPVRRHIIGIDGLRGIAALTVLFHHVAKHTTDASQTGMAGRIAELAAHGLTLFFVLSGFLLFMPFAKAIINGRPVPSLSRYAINRFLRIVPAYVVIFLLVSLVFGAAMTQGTPAIFGYGSIGYLRDPATFFIDLFLVQTYIPGYILTGIGPAWSLTTEIAFYVAMPLLAIVATLAARRINHIAAVFIAPAVLIVTGWVTTALLAGSTAGMSVAEAAEFSWGQTGTAVLERSLLSQADLFGYGMLAAIALVLIQRRRSTSPWWWKAATLALGGVMVVAAFRIGFDAFTGSVMGVASALLLLTVVLPPMRETARGNLLAIVLEMPVFRFFGLISYSVYLWHVPVITWLLQRGWTFGEGTAGLALTTLLVAATTVGLATITYLLIEKPALSLKGKIGRPRPRLHDKPSEQAASSASST